MEGEEHGNSVMCNVLQRQRMDKRANSVERCWEGYKAHFLKPLPNLFLSIFPSCPHSVYFSIPPLHLFWRVYKSWYRLITPSAPELNSHGCLGWKAKPSTPSSPATPCSLITLSGTSRGLRMRSE